MFVKKSILTNLEPNEVHTILFTSDWHLESKNCDTSVIKKDLDRARKIQKRNKVSIIHLGDICDAIAIKDKRYSIDTRVGKLASKPDYVNGVIEMVIDIVADYVDMFDMFVLGNHEQKFMQISDCDLISSISHKIYDVFGKQIIHGSTEGLLSYENPYIPYRILYHHGSGNTGGASKGVGWLVKTSAPYQGNFDISVCGHGHETISWRGIAFDMNSQGLEQIDTKYAQVGNYLLRHNLEDNDPSSSDYAAQKRLDPKPVGGLFVNYYITLENGKYILNQECLV